MSSHIAYMLASPHSINAACPIKEDQTIHTGLKHVAAPLLGKSCQHNKRKEELGKKGNVSQHTSLQAALSLLLAGWQNFRPARAGKRCSCLNGWSVSREHAEISKMLELGFFITIFILCKT